MSAEQMYSGESVQSAIRRLYGQDPDAPIHLPHATVPPVTVELAGRHASVFDTVLSIIREQLISEQQRTAAAAVSTSLAGHWLLSVPAPLRQTEEDVVNYLGMLVAFDFCHWAEVRHGDSATAATNEVRVEEEEGGIVATGGEEVTNFAGFYAVVEEAPRASTCAMSSGGVPPSPPSHDQHEGEELLVEPKASTETLPEGEKPLAKDTTLLRGSAAMMWLLRRAVEVHNIPWYDVRYLQQFNGDVDAALDALRPCFMGCEQDGTTTLWMPCTRTRVRLLLSLADAFQTQRTSFYQLLRECAGFMFRPPPDTAAARDGVRGFVPSLVHFHPRYHDFTTEHGSEEEEAEEGAAYIPILKLSQLTALALEQALPALWCHRYSAPAQASSPSSSPSSDWLAARAEAIATTLTSSTASGASLSDLTGLFTDRAELSICCDYQIPKTLRAVGLIAYDAHLARVVDHHVLMLPGSAEEASIRIATLIAAHRLLCFLNARAGRALLAPEEAASAAATTLPPCTVNHLDYALWYVGRYMVPSEARHHLCRTIMY